jgi:hypothetical protein
MMWRRDDMENGRWGEREKERKGDVKKGRRSPGERNT